jgi:hypothetical protein
VLLDDAAGRSFGWSASSLNGSILLRTRPERRTGREEPPSPPSR